MCVSVSTSAELPDVPVVPYGSSITTYIANLGFSAEYEDTSSSPDELTVDGIPAGTASSN